MKDKKRLEFLMVHINSHMQYILNMASKDCVTSLDGISKETSEAKNTLLDSPLQLRTTV